MRRALALLIAALTAAALLGVVSTASTATTSPSTGAATGAATSASAATTTAAVAQRGRVSMRLRRAIKRLPVAGETRRGYDRDKFRHWVDPDGDCRDTRDEVLAAESRTSVRGCDIRRGRWFSYYDRRVWRRSSDVDIDHLVALAEAWDSGAKRWNAATRRRFANDLGDRRSLVAVTDNVNMSKSDRDPAEWMPRRGRCRYVREWTAVKIRWSLKVDRAEKRALLRRARNCTNPRIHVRKARIGTRSSTGGGAPRGGTDPRFSTCTEAKAHGYGPYRRGVDREYHWYRDADGDGWVCE